MAAVSFITYILEERDLCAVAVLLTLTVAHSNINSTEGKITEVLTVLCNSKHQQRTSPVGCTAVGTEKKVI